MPWRKMVYRIFQDLSRDHYHLETPSLQHSPQVGNYCSCWQWVSHQRKKILTARDLFSVSLKVTIDSHLRRGYRPLTNATQHEVQTNRAMIFLLSVSQTTGPACQSDSLWRISQKHSDLGPCGLKLAPVGIHDGGNLQSPLPVQIHETPPGQGGKLRPCQKQKPGISCHAHAGVFGTAFLCDLTTAMPCKCTAWSKKRWI